MTSPSLQKASDGGNDKGENRYTSSKILVFNGIGRVLKVNGQNNNNKEQEHTDRLEIDIPDPHHTNW